MLALCSAVASTTLHLASRGATTDSHLNRYYLDDERSVKFLSSLSFISSLTQIYVALAFLIAVCYKLLTLFVPY